MLLIIFLAGRSGDTSHCTDVGNDPVTKLTLSSGAFFKDKTPAPLNGPCNQTFRRIYTSNASRAAIRAELETQLDAMGFRHVKLMPSSPWDCDHRLYMDQYHRDDVTVRLIIHPPPFPLSRGRTLRPGQADYAVVIKVMNNGSSRFHQPCKSPPISLPEPKPRGTPPPSTTTPEAWVGSTPR